MSLAAVPVAAVPVASLAATTPVASHNPRKECNFSRVSAWPIHNIIPPEKEGYCKGEDDVCPSIFIPLDRIYREMALYDPQGMSNFVLNIGARDGVAADPLYPLFQTFPETEAVLVELQHEWFAKLKKNYARFPKAHLVNKGIDLRNFNQVLRKPGRRHISSQSMDILKFDIDSCECHFLELMLAKDDGYFRAKVIQVELNHVLPPPLSFKDMCPRNNPGRSKGQRDVWGCSMQAAYDLVKPYGYLLLQYDWPDAVFVHESFQGAFPCLLQGNNEEIFRRNYWIGHDWAKQHYKRRRRAYYNTTWNEHIEETALSSFGNPRGTLEGIINQYKRLFLRNNPMWKEFAVSGSGVRATVATDKAGGFVIKWKAEEKLAEHTASPETPEI